jgi:DNA-binding MarR family transcriptional regulator
MTQPPTLNGQVIAETQGALLAMLEAQLGPVGISSNEYVVLRALAVRGVVASASMFHESLAGQRQLGLDLPAAADLLTGLADRGFIKGAPPEGPGPVELTPAGADLYARVDAANAPITKQLFDGFHPDDLATTRRVLSELKERAQRLRAEAVASRADPAAER